MIQPANVGGERSQGLHLAEIWCNACVRCVKVPIDDLPPEIPIPDICLRYRCSVCGGKNLSSRMSIKEQSRKTQEVTRKSHGMGVAGTGARIAGSVLDRSKSMLKIVIVNPAGYEAVMSRIQELSGAPEDTPEGAELMELVETADAWDRGKGDEVAGETPDVPIQDSSW